jgi:hypothetical protein
MPPFAVCAGGRAIERESVRMLSPCLVGAGELAGARVGSRAIGEEVTGVDGSFRGVTCARLRIDGMLKIRVSAVRFRPWP